MTEKRLRELMDKEIMGEFLDTTEPETYDRRELIKSLNSATNRVIYRYFREKNGSN